MARPHAWFDVVAQADGTIIPGAVDAFVGGVERFRVYQVRFQLLNDSDRVVELAPLLEFGDGATPTAFAAVPSFDEGRSAPFFVSADGGVESSEWVEPIAATGLRAMEVAMPAAASAAGAVAHGSNPGPTITLAPHAFTEVAFAVRATAKAAWHATYAFRLAPSSIAPVASATALVSMADKPTIELSPGQRRGVTVDDPIPLYQLQQPEPPLSTSPGARSSTLALPMAAAFTSPHQEFGLTGDSCAACHSAHAALGPFLTQQPPPVASQCFACHDGSGAVADVKGQYANASVPANDALTASWYSHPATATSNHTTDREDEFGGTLERHAACADCHQPHLADAGVPSQTTAGWTASGAIAGASGVSVVNGPAGTVPTFTRNSTSSFEYELCFKCHSGFTQLPSNDPAHPSRWALDKSVELNPSNASYHPVEAAGRNVTPAMASSLAGTSPYKLWTFQVDSTIRCVNCHGDSRLATPASPPDAAAQLAPHAVPNRSLLMSPYRDRVLKPATEPYAAADFALCYQCHAESPMVDWSGDPNAATNFDFHGFHLMAIDAEGTGGLDIDMDGHGEGNAICAECHFRIHGTTEAVDGQADNARLVNFAPNVQPYRGVLQWTGAPTGGSCTLVCHGITHSNWTY